MQDDELVIYGTSFAMGLLLMIAALFFSARFVVRPMELDQFDFRKRIYLAFKSMQGEENFFSKIGHRKLVTYRRMLMLSVGLTFILLGVSFWLHILQPTGINS